MSRKVYKIELINSPPVYLPTKRRVGLWFGMNPGEGQGWASVDPVEELSELASALDKAEREIYLLRRKLKEYETETPLEDQP